MTSLDDAMDGHERVALVAWSTLAEAGDEAAAWLVETLGASEALVWVRDAARDPVSATARLAPFVDPRVIDRAIGVSERWSQRLVDCDPLEAVRRAEAIGARLVVRGEAEWPSAFDDLGGRAPFALWVRGGGHLGALLERSIAVVGSRASTSYGEHAAAELAGGVGDAGWTVLSGGAYGIDAAAHRAALTSSTPTVAVMAGGVDRLYPAGLSDMLERVMRHGIVVSEAPVGFAPHRSRFLARNRLIAAAAATCVVEAANRSGALNTVNHALSMGRPVGAVPGPVTSVSSQGCHRLVRDGLAVLVTSARDLIELAGPIGTDDEGTGRDDGFASADQRAAFDAIPARGARADAIARGAGVTISEVLAALGGLEMAGLATSEDGVWKRRAQNAMR